jgi:hypothetical protein
MSCRECCEDDCPVCGRYDRCRCDDHEVAVAVEATYASSRAAEPSGGSSKKSTTATDAEAEEDAYDAEAGADTPMPRPIPMPRADGSAEADADAGAEWHDNSG